MSRNPNIYPTRSVSRYGETHREKRRDHYQAPPHKKPFYTEPVQPRMALLIYPDGTEEAIQIIS